MSAITGGQWTQARRASVPAFGIDDNRCQLCFGEVGTVAHRRSCQSTMPEHGWSDVPEKARLAETVIGQRRVQLLETNGMLTVKVSARPWVKYDSFQWLSQPPPMDDETLIWYIDGSA